MSDAIDQGLDDAEMEDESDQIYGQVCEELGLEYGEGDQKAREGKIGVGQSRLQLGGLWITEIDLDLGDLALGAAIVVPLLASAVALVLASMRLRSMDVA